MQTAQTREYLNQMESKHTKPLYCLEQSQQELEVHQEYLCFCWSIFPLHGVKTL